MDSVDYIKPDFPQDAFVGTATYYARYRVPYPPTLINDLLTQVGHLGGGRLLDLACGPGRIAIPLSTSFREVWAIDLEPEMIEVGQQESRRRGVTNIKWLVGKAEELEAEPNAFELITIGEAFHRLDQWRIANQALQWLSTGGCIAILGGYTITSGVEPWQSIVAATVRQWTNQSALRQGRSSRPKPASGPDHNERVLRDVGFRDVTSVAFIHPYTWTVESILGNLYSTSQCSHKVLGHAVADFERELKHALLSYDRSGRYFENMRFGYTLARTPR